MADNGRRTLADTSSRSPDIDHRSRSCSIPSWDKVSSSLAESRFGSLDLHVMGSLSSLDCRSISRGDGTIFMADNGWKSLAHTKGSSRDNSTCLTEGCLCCFHLRSVSRNDGSIGVVDGRRGGSSDTSSRGKGINNRIRSGDNISWCQKAGICRIRVPGRSRVRSTLDVMED